MAREESAELRVILLQSQGNGDSEMLGFKCQLNTPGESATRSKVLDEVGPCPRGTVLIKIVAVGRSIPNVFRTISWAASWTVEK